MASARHPRFGLAVAAALAGVALGAGAAEFSAGKVRVVVEPGASKVVLFAAEEATNFLSRVLGAPVPVVNAPEAGTTSLFLGDSKWARAEGLDPTDKPHDSFFLKSTRDAVYVVGRDHPTANPRTASVWAFERGTLNGLYGFLEEDVGIRFYFPGELGEVVPRRGAFTVPEGTRLDKPDFLIRRYMLSGKWFDGVPERTAAWLGRLQWIRLRATSTSIPCCHGVNKMAFADKFEKTHPEYFALSSNGSRHTRSSMTGRNQHGSMCFSSDIRDRVYEYCAEKLSGGAKYVDIMPNDAMPECHCDACQRSSRREGKGADATDIVWGYTKYVAEKLIANGIPGYVTQMAYAQYRRVPDFDLPTNVLVMVAQGGPWSMSNAERRDAQYAAIRAWARKTGGKVWIWTYPHKYGALNIPGIPDVAPRAWGEYYKPLKEDIFGTFAESETDLWLYHYLNYYVFARVMWRADADVGAIIDEHNSLMFGAAAPAMAKVYSTFEDKWVNKIAGSVVTTAVGPVYSPPTEDEIWNEIYSPAEVAAIGALFDEAAKAVAPQSLEGRRVEFFRRNYFEPLVAGARTFADKRRAVEALVWKRSSGAPIELRPFKPSRKKPPEEFVKTRVTAEKTSEAVVVRFDCEDNRMDDVLAKPRDLDDADTWRDAGVEVTLNPNGDRKTYFHLIANIEGSISDSRGVRQGSKGSTPEDMRWNSGAKAEVSKRPDGWSMTLTIPLANLGEVRDAFPAEFVRNRITRSGKGYCRYNWSPFAFGFTSVEDFGTVDLSK